MAVRLSSLWIFLPLSIELQAANSFKRLPIINQRTLKHIDIVTLSTHLIQRTHILPPLHAHIHTHTDISAHTHAYIHMYRNTHSLIHTHTYLHTSMNPH